MFLEILLRSRVGSALVCTGGACVGPH
jgi:hypothetical protein